VDPDDPRAVADRLDYLIGQVTPDEFHWQDANYDRDSALGRELPAGQITVDSVSLIAQHGPERDWNWQSLASIALRAQRGPLTAPSPSGSSWPA